MLFNCIAVGIGGFIGSTLRYLLGLAMPDTGFPVTTLCINIGGSFLLAFIAAQVSGGAITNERLSLLLRVGLCGGFTTFSTYSLETMHLVQDGRSGAALAYVLVTCCLCLCASFAGNWASGAIRGA